MAFTFFRAIEADGNYGTVSTNDAGEVWLWYGTKNRAGQLILSKIAIFDTGKGITDKTKQSDPALCAQALSHLGTAVPAALGTGWTFGGDGATATHTAGITLTMDQPLAASWVNMTYTHVVDGVPVEVTGRLAHRVRFLSKFETNLAKLVLEASFGLTGL